MTVFTELYTLTYFSTSKSSCFIYCPGKVGSYKQTLIQQICTCCLGLRQHFLAIVIWHLIIWHLICTVVFTLIDLSLTFSLYKCKSAYKASLYKQKIGLNKFIALCFLLDGYSSCEAFISFLWLQNIVR